MDSRPTTTTAVPHPAPSGPVVPPAGVSSSDKKGYLPLLLQILAVALILTPAVVAAYLVHDNVVNTPHYDDFTFLEDWLKYKTGNLTWGDLFSVHLEHRVTVPRVMAVAAHIFGGSDLRWQNGMTLLLLLGSLWNLTVIWRRTTGATLRASWFPLFLISSVLFCAVQWQMLLWPILFEIIVPIFCVTLMLLLWAGRMNAWAVMAVSILLCGICMLCFANGPVVLCLPPFCLWLQRPGLEMRNRLALLGTWFLAAAVILALNFLTNYHNAAPTQFAYWYDDKMTAWDTIKAFVGDSRMSVWEKIIKAVSFTFAVLGSHLSRGLHLNNLSTAQWMGFVSVMLFAAAVIWLLVKWRDKDLLRNAGPWVVLGLYSGGTATFIMLGRVGRTISGSMAITPRYMTHSVPLTIALIALVWILGHRLATRWRSVGAGLGGAFLFLICVEWSYGMQWMELWQNARLQGKGLLMFANVFKPYDYLGQVSGVGEYGAQVMQELDKVGQSPVPLLKNRLLNQFHISSRNLRHRQAGFDSLHLTKGGGLEAHGFAELPAKRPADLILFTTKNSEGIDEIFGIEYLVRFPDNWNETTQKDEDWCSILPMKSDYYARWEGPMHLYERKLPPPGAVISVWALDVERRYVYAIPDHRTSPDPLPPLPPKPVDDESK